MGWPESNPKSFIRIKEPQNFLGLLFVLDFVLELGLTSGGAGCCLTLGMAPTIVKKSFIHIFALNQGRHSPFAHDESTPMFPRPLF